MPCCRPARRCDSPLRHQAGVDLWPGGLVGQLGPQKISLTAVRALNSAAASNSESRPTIAGRPIYLGGRKPAVLACRDEVVAAVEALIAGGGAPIFTVENVHAAMVSCGSAWSRETVAKTMLRMTRPARRPPYLQLEQAGPDLYRVVPSRDEVRRSSEFRGAIRWCRTPTCGSNRPLDAMGSATTTYDTLWHAPATWETTPMHWTQTLP